MVRSRTDLLLYYFATDKYEAQLSGLMEEVTWGWVKPIVQFKIKMRVSYRFSPAA